MRTMLPAGIFIAALAVIGLMAARERAVPPPRDATAAAAYWQQRIGAVGGAKAYAELAAQLAPLDPSARHGLAHAFGGALYKAVGIEGIRTCDAQFSYGCYHELIGEAIAAHGLSIVGDLNAACNTLPYAGPCLHGIGHGLVAYLGYQPPDLKKAVAECAAIDHAGSLQGCFGGAFMEYNMRTLAGPHATRAAAADIYAPCDSYTGVIAESCYLYQPQWWSEAMQASSTAASFARMAAACGRLAGVQKSACERGVGEMAPYPAGYTAAGAYALCAGHFSDRSLAHCAEGAAVVSQGTRHAAVAHDICARVPTAYAAECTAYASGATIL